MKHNIRFETNIVTFENDYLDVIRAFSGYINLCENGDILSLNMQKCMKNEQFLYKISIKCVLLSEDFNFDFSLSVSLLDLKIKSQEKRFSKVALYEVLSKISGKTLPYGSLTGIRPTKLFKEMLLQNEDAQDFFENVLKVSASKTQLIMNIVNNQIEFWSEDDLAVDLFINIPICVSRCAYCSFLSAEFDKIKKLITPYCDLLVKEIKHAKMLIKKYNFSVRSVYIGGGTPTSLDEKNFERIISECNIGCNEFTVEAGRPDTINKEKLDIMASNGVTRISINPQTFNQKTLDIIGRKHSVAQIYETFELARNYNFDINMDLIAMLPNESFEDFCYSVDCAIKLSPQNITVHTLAIKRGSTLAEAGYDNFDANTPQKMVDYSFDKISKAGYNPYYMYKQKYMSGNLENVGYCKSGSACVYNIDIMEETNTILACGAGGISKAVNHAEHRLERLANPKGIDVYLQREMQNCEKKESFFDEFVSQLDTVKLEK